MQKRPLRTSSGRYLLWAASVVAVVLIALLIAATIWFGFFGAVVIGALTAMMFMLLLKAWEAGKIPFLKLSSSRTLPYYQPSGRPSQEHFSSERERSSYKRGYREQSYYQPSQEPFSRQEVRPRSNALPKEESPAAYAEQPQAQYPEQMPPMM
ncbi:MAG TPA: hypothetical protein VFA10_30170 [Ktedonobacteraceae bacterium]|nr:hypothetical protein [Ktedonobacteraceae bacterium]